MILIFETIFSILTSPLLLLLIFPFMLLRYTRDKYVLSIYIGTLFGLLSFAFTPVLEGGTDLDRYLIDIQNFFSNASFSQVIQMSLKKGEFLVDILMYLSIRLGNPHFFPMILMFIFYSISTYIIIDLGVKYGAVSKRILYILFVYLTLVPYAYVGETIRNATGVLLVFLGIYLYSYRKKNILYLLLFTVLGIGIHVSSVAMIPLFFLTSFYKRYSRTAISVIIFLSTSSPIVITLLSKYFGGINPIVTDFFDKGIRYLSTKDSDYIAYLEGSAFMHLQRIFFVCIIVFFFIITSYITRNRYQQFSRFNLKLLTFFNLLSVFIIGLSFIKTDIYIRFTMLWLLLLSFYFYRIEGLLLDRLHPTEQKIYRILVGIIVIGGALHQVVYFKMIINISKTFEKFIFFHQFL